MSVHNLWSGGGPYTGEPFTVPEDGWIKAKRAIGGNGLTELYVWVNGESPSSISPASTDQTYMVRSSDGSTVTSVSDHSSWVPVRKGDVVSNTYQSISGHYSHQVVFAPCRGNSAKTN